MNVEPLVVTPKMLAAGEEMASDLLTISLVSLDVGENSLFEVLNPYCQGKNGELLMCYAYNREKFPSVAVIYLAMERARLEEA